MDKVAKNGKGSEISYGQELEDKIRKFYDIPDIYDVPDHKVFEFFASVYENALDKGKYTEE